MYFVSILGGCSIYFVPGQEADCFCYRNKFRSGHPSVSPHIKVNKKEYKMQKAKWVISAAALVLAASANAGFGGNYSYNNSYSNDYADVQVSKTVSEDGTVSFTKTVTKANGETYTYSVDKQVTEDGVTINKNVNGNEYSYKKNFYR